MSGLARTHSSDDRRLNDGLPLVRALVNDSGWGIALKVPILSSHLADWRFDHFVTDLLLGCKQGELIEPEDQVTMRGFSSERSGPLSAAIAVAIEGPAECECAESSIERTLSGLRPPSAPHVKRWPRKSPFQHAIHWHPKNLDR